MAFIKSIYLKRTIGCEAFNIPNSTRCQILLNFSHNSRADSPEIDFPLGSLRDVLYVRRKNVLYILMVLGTFIYLVQDVHV